MSTPPETDWDGGLMDFAWLERSTGTSLKCNRLIWRHAFLLVAPGYDSLFIFTILNFRGELSFCFDWWRIRRIRISPRLKKGRSSFRKVDWEQPEIDQVWRCWWVSPPPKAYYAMPTLYFLFLRDWGHPEIDRVWRCCHHHPGPIKATEHRVLPEVPPAGTNRRSWYERDCCRRHQVDLDIDFSW